VLEANVGYINDEDGYLQSAAEAQRIAIASAEVALDPVGGTSAGAMSSSSVPGAGGISASASSGTPAPGGGAAGSQASSSSSNSKM
jgi:cobalt-zinc-cadmium efflux system outer membrane protein